MKIHLQHVKIFFVVSIQRLAKKDMGWIFQSPWNSVSRYQIAPGLLLQIKMVIEDFIKTVSKGKGCLSNTDLVSHTNESAKNGTLKDRKWYSLWWQIGEDWVRGQKNTWKSPKTTATKSQVIVINWQMNALISTQKPTCSWGWRDGPLFVSARCSYRRSGFGPSTHLVADNCL